MDLGNGLGLGGSYPLCLARLHIVPNGPHLVGFVSGLGFAFSSASRPYSYMGQGRFLALTVPKFDHILNTHNNNEWLKEMSLVYASLIYLLFFEMTDFLVEDLFLYCSMFFALCLA